MRLLRIFKSGKRFEAPHIANVPRFRTKCKLLKKFFQDLFLRKKWQKNIWGYILHFHMILQVLQMTFLDFWQHNIDQEDPPLKAVLFDVDGTVVAGRDMMPGADKVIDFLRKKNTPFLFLTNDGNHSTSQKARRISRAGVEVQPEEIISCSHALSDFVEQNSLAGSKAFVMGELGSPCYAEAAGVIPCRNLEEIDECSFVIAGESYFDWHDVFHGVMNYFMCVSLFGSRVFEIES
jgi:hypothetical protein